MRILASLAVVLLAAGCSHKPAAPARPDVVVIVLDTVRPDYLSAYGAAQPTSPFLASFASQGTLYEQAWSSAPWTLPAHATLFSGTETAFHRATQSTEHVGKNVPLLAERLRAAGYQTLGLSNNMWVSKATGLDRGFEAWREDWDNRARRRGMGATHPTVQALSDFLAHGRDPARPLFAFVNLTDAHMPYLSHWPEEAQDFFAGKAEWQAAINALFPDAGQALLARNYGGRPLAEAELEALRNLYRASLRRVDMVTQALLRALDARCDPKNTLVFVLSDHGENLGEHGHISHVFNLYETNLRIALLARGPGFAAGAHERRPVQIADLYPTILHAAGLEPEPGCSGLDLHGAPAAGRIVRASLEKPVVSLGTFPEELRRSGVLARFDRTLESALFGTAKEIQAGDGSSERYDLAADPGERNVLPELPAEVQQALAQSIARTLALWESRRSFEFQGSATSDERTRAGLKNLGYTAGDK